MGSLSGTQSWTRTVAAARGLWGAAGTATVPAQQQWLPWLQDHSRCISGQPALEQHLPSLYALHSFIEMVAN